MFDPNQRRIASKTHVWDRVRKGELMTLTIDLETSGIGRQKVPYATPGYPFITEYADCLTDLAGNYHSSGQVKPRRPDPLPFEPPAALMNRDPQIGPELFDGQDRMPFTHGMSAIVWRAQQAAFAYEDMARQFGDKKKVINITDFNKSFRRGEEPGKIKATEEVYDIPLLDDNGKIVYDVRYHPDRRKISYRFHKNGAEWESKDYQGDDNLYYSDDADGTTWKWVDAGVNFDGYNFNRYDLPILRVNLYRAGFSPANTAMFYARSTPTSKQLKKPTLTEVRDLAYMVKQFGDQGEGGLKMGEIEDPATGRIRRSEALGAYHKKNSKQAIPGRLIRGGPFDPRDGSYFDLKLAHGGVADAAATAALRNLCWDIAPDLCAMMYAQSDQRKLYEMLTAQSVNGDSLPLFFLPRRESGLSHSVLPYWFLGTDDQIGRFGRMMFLKADGSFRKEAYNGKPLKDLSVDEWVEYLGLQEQRRDPDRPVRTETLRRFPGAMPYEKGLLQDALRGHSKDEIEGSIQDAKFILEHPEMCERIMQAMAVRNYMLRYGKKPPHNEYLEDALGRKFGGISYQDEACELENRMIFQRTGKGGPQGIPGILQTLKSRMQNDYEFMGGIDEGLDQMMTTAHPIDWFQDLDPAVKLHERDDPEGELAREVFQDYIKLVERVVQKFRSHGWPYIDIFESIINPETGEPFIKGGKFKAQTPGQAYMFRKLLGKRALKDFELLLRLKHSPYLEGYVDQKFSEHFWGEKRLLLHANPDNGQGGAAPHVVNETGHEVPIEVIKGLNSHIDYGKGSNRHMRDTLDNLINTGAWKVQFYKDRTEPGIMRLAQRFVDMGDGDELGAGVRMMYASDVLNRMEGMTNEDATTDRTVTLRTMKQSCKAIRAALTSRDPRVLERDINPAFAASFKALQPEEAMQKLVWIEGWIKKQEKQMKALRKSLPTEIARRTDPESGLPLDFIPITIPRDSSSPMEQDPNFILMDVPIWHMRAPVEQNDNRFPRKFLVVPAMKSQFREAANKEQGAKPVLVRGMEDGRIAATGRRTRIETFPQTDPALAPVWNKVRDDYGRSGIKLDDKSKLWMVSVEDVYPLAGTKPVDWSIASIKLPKSHFDALTAPVYANMGSTPLSAVLMPLDYFPQDVTTGEKVRLRQMDTAMFSNIHGETDAADTGHTYETRITKIFGLDEKTGEVKGIKRGEFIRRVEKGEIPKKYLEAAGFVGGSVQHVRQVLDSLVTAKWKSKPDDMPLVLVAFQKVNGTYAKNGRQERHNTYAYCHLTKPPHAAFAWDGEPVLPGVYKDID